MEEYLIKYGQKKKLRKSEKILFKPCDNTFIGPVGPIKFFISPKAGKNYKNYKPASQIIKL